MKRTAQGLLVSMLAMAPFALASLTACSAPVEEGDGDVEQIDDALRDAPAQAPLDGVAPIVFELKPSTPQLKLELEREWTKAVVDVLDRDYAPTWVTAEKEDKPAYVPRINEFGVGSGTCRVKLNLKKVMVGCRWKF